MSTLRVCATTTCSSLAVQQRVAFDISGEQGIEQDSADRIEVLFLAEQVKDK